MKKYRKCPALSLYLDRLGGCRRVPGGARRGPSLRPPLLEAQEPGGLRDNCLTSFAFETPLIWMWTAKSN